MNLSKNFTLEEMTQSEYALRHGIDNTPDERIIENLKFLCETYLEPLRAFFKLPIIVTSGYRCPEVNKGIGGSITSAHLEGRAADIRVPPFSPYHLCNEISRFFKRCDEDFDQIILEFNSWVHIGYAKQNRNQVIVAQKVENKTIYIPFEEYSIIPE